MSMTLASLVQGTCQTKNTKGEVCGAHEMGHLAHHQAEEKCQKARDGAPAKPAAGGETCHHKVHK